MNTNTIVVTHANSHSAHAGFRMFICFFHAPNIRGLAVLNSPPAR